MVQCHFSLLKNFENSFEITKINIYQKKIILKFALVFKFLCFICEKCYLTNPFIILKQQYQVETLWNLHQLNGGSQGN